MERKSRRNVEEGRLFEAITTSPGWEVYFNRLKEKLAFEDKKVHDVRLREDLGKYHMGVYYGLRLAIELHDELLKSKRIGEDYLKRNNI